MGSDVRRLIAGDVGAGVCCHGRYTRAVGFLPVMRTHSPQTRDSTRCVGVIIRCIESTAAGGETIRDGRAIVHRGIFEIVRGVKSVGIVCLAGGVEAGEGGGVVGCGA